MKLKAKRIILFVKNVPKTAEFYRDKLGLKINGDPKNTSWIDINAGGMSIGIHKGGKGKTTSKLVFFAKDVEKVRAKLLKADVKMGKLHAFGEIRFCDGKDPEGNPFQISNRT